MSTVRLLILLAGIGCAACQAPPRDVVILLADPDGRVGKAEVATPGGRQTLDAARHMTTVIDQASPPTAIVRADNAYIEHNFSAAMAAQPPSPLKFILYFLPDSDELDAPSQALVPDVVAAIRKHSPSDIGIHGHSDRVGASDRNIALSLRRASAVRDLLQKYGINTEQFEVTSHGEGNPLVPTANDIAEPRNRRVEVVVR